MVDGCKIEQDMKRILNILTATLLFIGFATSCETAPKVEEGIIGEWQLTEMDGLEASTISTSVYVEFKADQSFDMYQKVGSISRYRKFTGTIRLFLNFIYECRDVVSIVLSIRIYSYRITISPIIGLL